jgi:hypothetical protein
MAPDVASRPERIKKDLFQVKQLAAILEEEAATLRRFSPTRARKAAAAAALKNSDGTDDPTESKNEEDNHPPEPEPLQTEGDGEIDPDVEVETEDEPKEKGSEAVERRIQKIIADLQDQSSPGELEDGIGWEAKKVYIIIYIFFGG